jgi:hypothetical protein
VHVPQYQPVMVVGGERDFGVARVGSGEAGGTAHMRKSILTDSQCLTGKKTRYGMGIQRPAFNGLQLLSVPITSHHAR